MRRSSTFWYDAAWRVVQETHRDQTNGAGPLEESVIQQAWGARYIDDAVARLRLAGNGSGGVAAGSTQEVAFQLTDAQFSVIAVATPGKPGVVIDRIAYSAYGEATRTLRSDVNGDGFVNKDDYNGVIRSRLNTTIGSAGYAVEADLDRDGKVAQSDYDIAIADDGKSSSGGVGEAGLFAKGVRNSVGYCGYIFNDESGLYTVRYRSYSPTLGRWLERDPAGYVDGMGLYEYVRGGPITAVDPWGRWTVPVSLISAAMLALDCGIRIGSREFDLDAEEKGHVWIEWHEYDERGQRLFGTSVGYYPLQTVRDMVPPRILPAGGFSKSTLYGPSRDRNSVVPYIPESCGLRDPHERGAIGEWMAARRVKPERYYKLEPVSAGTLIWNRRVVHSYSTSEFLHAGSASGQPCARATCAQIVDCLRHIPPSAEWSVGVHPYTCRDFVDEALRACCLTRGCKTK